MSGTPASGVGWPRGSWGCQCGDVPTHAVGFLDRGAPMPVLVGVRRSDFFVDDVVVRNTAAVSGCSVESVVTMLRAAHRHARRLSQAAPTKARWRRCCAKARSAPAAGPPVPSLPPPNADFHAVAAPSSAWPSSRRRRWQTPTPSRALLDRGALVPVFVGVRKSDFAVERHSELWEKHSLEGAGRGGP